MFTDRERLEWVAEKLRVVDRDWRNLGEEVRRRALRQIAKSAGGDYEVGEEAVTLGSVIDERSIQRDAVAGEENGAQAGE